MHHRCTDCRIVELLEEVVELEREQKRELEMIRKAVAGTQAGAAASYSMHFSKPQPEGA